MELNQNLMVPSMCFHVQCKNVIIAIWFCNPASSKVIMCFNLKCFAFDLQVMFLMHISHYDRFIYWFLKPFKIVDDETIQS